MVTLMRIGPLIGRILMALIFLFSGYGKLTGFDGTVEYIASKSIPMPQFVAVGAIIVELCGGVMLVVGWRARLAAAALFIFTALAALLFHNFWSASADQAQNQMIHFMKNITIMGGLLYVVVHGSGPISVDRKHH